MDNVSSASIQLAMDSDLLHIENPKEFVEEDPEVIQNITRILVFRIINLSKQIAMLVKSIDQSASEAEEQMLSKVLGHNAQRDNGKGESCPEKSFHAPVP